MGELWGVFCEYLWEKWPRYNGTALYLLSTDIVWAGALGGRLMCCVMWQEQTTNQGASFIGTAVCLLRRGAAWGQTLHPLHSLPQTWNATRYVQQGTPVTDKPTQQKHPGGEQLIGPQKVWLILGRRVISKHHFVTDILNISCKIALRWMVQDPIDNESTLVQVKAWCHHAPSHYLNRCWPQSTTPYGITRTYCVNHT